MPTDNAERIDPDAVPVEIARAGRAWTPGEIRLYLQSVVRLAVAGKLDKDLAKIAVAAAPAWLKACEMSDHQAELEKRLVALERAQEKAK
jgi:hypothetical protein